MASVRIPLLRTSSTKIHHTTSAANTAVDVAPVAAIIDRTSAKLCVKELAEFVRTTAKTKFTATKPPPPKASETYNTPS